MNILSRILWVNYVCFFNLSRRLKIFFRIEGFDFVPTIFLKKIYCFCASAGEVVIMDPFKLS